MPPTPPTPEPHVLPDHYRVWRREDGSWWRLGRGSVYKATDLRTDQTVALRFLDAGPRTPDAMGALAGYAALLARPGSPLVAPLRDFFISGDFNVAATEFIAGESLAERVRRDGPLAAGAAWDIACRLLEALRSLHDLGIAHGSLEASKILFPADADDEAPLRVVEAGLHPAASVAADPLVGSDSTREDLHRLGATLWFALTGDDLFPAAPDEPLPWQRLDVAGITPALGRLPVLLARTLTGDPAQRPATAPALLAALNVLESLTAVVPVSQDMPSRAPGSESVAPTLAPRPPLPGAEHGELWTRPARQFNAPNRPNRRRRQPGRFWNALLLWALGAAMGFLVGVGYEKHRHGENLWPSWAFLPILHTTPLPTPAPSVAIKPAPVEPEVPPLPPSPPVSAAGIAARLERIQTLQPDVGSVLKYARQLRRVGTLPVADDASFPTDALVARLLERFDWRDPTSPNFRRTPLLLVLEYPAGTPEAAGEAAAQSRADAMAQALVSHGITSPIYTCGMGAANEVPEIETARAAEGRFVEVWVAFTLF